MPPCHDIRIRRATGADAAAIADVGARAFRAAFSHLFPAGVLERYLESEYTAAVIGRSLGADANHYWVAENTEVSGFIKLRGNRHHLALSRTRPWQIEKLYIDPDASGRGCGARLLAAAEAFVRTNAGDCCWLLVHTGNHRAIGFYRRHGYAKAGEDSIAIEDVEIPFDLMLKAPVAASARAGDANGG